MGVLCVEVLLKVWITWLRLFREANVSMVAVASSDASLCKDYKRKTELILGTRL